MDVPHYHIGQVTLPLGLSLSPFTAAEGGPLYKTGVYENTLQIAQLEVAFVTGLQGLWLDSVKLIDQGRSRDGGGYTRWIQLKIELLNHNFQAKAPDLSLPITVRIDGQTITPCCNPERLTLTLDLKCQRQYPFFSPAPQNESVKVEIEPRGAVDIKLFGLIDFKQFGFDHDFIENKLGHLVSKYANTALQTSSISGLGTFYPHPEVTIAAWLSFFIKSNLPMSSSSEWDFCPDARSPA